MTDEHLEWTGERYVPEEGGTIALEHVHRYLVARELAKEKDVLDIACGEGYGSAMLAEISHHVSGVDIAPEAIAHATKKYHKDNLQFLVGSCAAIPIPDDSIDLVVSFETIEHHDQHQEIMQEIKRVLRPDGVLIISSPDKYEFTDIGEMGTHFHVKELYRPEFEGLISSFFENVIYSGQRVLFGSAIFREGGECNIENFSQDSIDKAAVKGLIRPLYLIAIASDGNIPEFASGILELRSDELQRLQRGCEDALMLQEIVHQEHLVSEEKDRQLHQMNQKLAEKDEQLNQRNLELAEKDEQLNHRNLELAEKDEQLHQRNLELAQKDEQLNQRNLELAEKDEQLNQRNLELAQKDEQLNQRNLDLTEKDEQLNQRKGELAKLVELLRQRNLKVENKNELLRQNILEAKESKILSATLKSALLEKEEELSKIEKEKRTLEEALQEIHQSLIWKISSPFRRLSNQKGKSKGQ